MPYVPKQYDSSRKFLLQYTDLGNIADPMDKARCQAYALYEDFYRNRPDTFEVTLRGSSDTEIYVPSSKIIINGTARYLAVEPELNIKGGNAAAVQALFDEIWAREEVVKKLTRSKKDMLSWGDYVWYITADPSKPDRKRISLNVIHPSAYFPIEDPENGNRVIGCYLVDLIRDPREPKNRDKVVARRQAYYRPDHPTMGNPAGVVSECRTFELGKWDDRYLPPEDLKPISTVTPPQVLNGITSLPVYHIPIDPPTGSSFGTSILAGIEYVINAVNQSMTYEDLTLVLQGLGVYVTTAGPPRDPVTNKPMKYKLHPGNVIEMSQGDEFERVTGVSSVSPFQDHIGSLRDWAMQGAGLPDIAAGEVDVSVAESGIALAFKMGPILAENQDRQLEIKGKWDQMLYDLTRQWFPRYEGIQPGNDLKVEMVFGDPMPLNREATVTELTTLEGQDLILVDEVRKKLEKLGYEYSPNVVEKLLEQMQKKNAALNPDPYQSESDSGSEALSDLESLGSSVSSGLNGSGP